MLWYTEVTGFLILFWTAWSVRFGAPAWVGPLYPLGALWVSGSSRAAGWAAPELNGRGGATRGTLIQMRDIISHRLSGLPALCQLESIR